MLAITRFAISVLALASTAYSAPSSFFPNSTFTNSTSVTPSSWDVKYPKDFLKYSCDIGNAHGANPTKLEDGVWYLTTLPATSVARIAPGSHCDRVSCSYGAGIFFCNENNHELTAEWTQIAQAAELLIAKCNENWKVKGRVDFKGNWDGMVRLDGARSTEGAIFRWWSEQR